MQGQWHPQAGCPGDLISRRDPVFTPRSACLSCAVPSRNAKVDKTERKTQGKTSDSASNEQRSQGTAGLRPASSPYSGFTSGLSLRAYDNDDDDAMQSGDPFFGNFGGDPLEAGFGLPGSYGSTATGDPKGLALGATYLDDLEDALLAAAPDMDADGNLLFSKPHQPYESPFAPSTVDPGPGASLSAKNVRSLPNYVPSFDAPFHSGLGTLPSGPTQWKPAQPPSLGQPPPPMPPFASSSSGASVLGVPQDPYGAMDETASTMSSDSSVGMGGHMPWHHADLSSTSMFGGGVGVMSQRMASEDVPSIKRRAERNAREQKRSLKITEQISHLKDVLASDGRTVKNSKMAILVEVEDYIKELEGQVSRLDVAAAGGGGSDFDMGDDMVVSQSDGSEAVTQQAVTQGLDYRALFKHVCVPMAVASTDGRIIDANGRFEAVTGLSRSELEKLTFFNLLAPEELQEAFTTVALMLQGLTTDRSFTRLLAPKPGRPPMYITVSLVRDATAPKYFNCSIHAKSTSQASTTATST